MRQLELLFVQAKSTGFEGDLKVSPEALTIFRALRSGRLRGVEQVERKDTQGEYHTRVDVALVGCLLIVLILPQNIRRKIPERAS